jgi:ATP synthase protein I
MTTPAPDNTPPPDKMPSADRTLADKVGSKATRKLHARRHGSSGVWFGLGMMGLIGWSVAVPTLIGAAIGSWLDSHYPGKHAWTLALLVAGLLLGCFNAWRWIAKEERAMRDDEEDDDA